MTIPVGFGQASIFFTGTGVPSGAAVVFGFENELNASAVACATVIGNEWRDEVMPVLVNDVTLSECLVKLGPDATGPTASVSYSTTGAIVSTATPPNSAYLVTKITGLGGRRGRGRMYVPGVDEVPIDNDGQIGSVKLGQLQTAFTAFYVNINAGGCRMMLLHGPATEWQLVNGQPRRVPIGGAVPAPTEVDDILVESIVATQRRRLRR